MNLTDRKNLIEAGRGNLELDLVIENVQLVNVYTGKIEPVALGIFNHRIVTPDAGELATRNRVDGRGMYALPGFMDTHVHLDSTLLTPAGLASVIVPHGTLTMLADPMEISNVAGIQGLEALFHSCDSLPYSIFLEISSRVPTAPGLETTGGELGYTQVSELLSWPEAVSLGELDPSKVLGLQDEYLQKVQRALDLGKICNGHTAGLSGRDLSAYVCGGLSDDHECVNYADAIARLRLGLTVLVREGSSERNLEPILKGALADGVDFSNLMFCTDDKHPNDIQTEGHLDYMVNRAIGLGVPPVTAIQMATLNAARHFRIEHLIGSLTPGRFADVILCPSLQQIVPEQVYFHGKLVAEQGSLVGKPPFSSFPDFLHHTVHLSSSFSEDDLRLPAREDPASVVVIELIRDQIINSRGKAILPCDHGAVQADVAQDVLKLAVVERYGKNGGTGITFVKGFGLRQGAIASSVSHDHHNIVVVGTNDRDMAICVRQIEKMQGGLIIATNGEVLGELPLPIAGLMSDKSAPEVIIELNRLNAVYRTLGGCLASPFMTLSFISLPTVPELGLTDKGVVDVRTHTLLSPYLP